MSTSPLVLITAGNGFVGYAVLAGALKAGVRVSLKNSVAAIQIFFCAAPRLKDYYMENVEL